MVLEIVFTLMMATTVVESQNDISRKEQQTLKLATKFMDVNFTNNVLWRMVTKNVGICSQYCYKDKQCLWLAYQSTDNICQGHNVTYTGQDSQAFESTVGTRNYFFTGKKMSYPGVLATASSIYDWPGVQTGPSGAIDGNLQTFFHSECETSTFPYLHLKWNTGFLLTNLMAVKRPTTESRFEDVYVFVGYENGDFKLCNRFLGATSDSKTRFTCPYPMEGDTIQIEHRGPLKDSALPPAGYGFRMLELAEVEVYGYQKSCN